MTREQAVEYVLKNPRGPFPPEVEEIVGELFDGRLDKKIHAAERGDRGVVFTRFERDYLIERTRAEIKEGRELIAQAERQMSDGLGPYDIELIRCDLPNLVANERWLLSVPIEEDRPLPNE